MKVAFRKMLTRFWTANSVNYENIIIVDPINRNTSDLKLRKGRTKLGKQGVRFLYIFRITRYKLNSYLKNFKFLY